MKLAALNDPNLPLGQKRRFLPYAPFALDPVLPLSVGRVRVDDLDVTEESLVSERCRLRPYVVPGWRTAKIEFVLADVDEALWRRSMPEADGSSASMIHFLRIRCPATRLRRSVRLHRQRKGSESRFVGEVTLHRDDVDRTVQIECESVRADSAASPVPWQGNDRLAWLARSPRWLVQVEEPRNPAGGAFDIAWVDFSDPKPEHPYSGQDSEILLRCSQALSHVLFRPDPLILVNRACPAVAEVLQSRETAGLRASVRNVLLNRIAVESWRTILLRALQTTGECFDQVHDEPADLGEEHWTTRVLKHAARQMKMDAEELAIGLADVQDGPGALFEVSERLGKVGSDVHRKLAEAVQS